MSKYNAVVVESAAIRFGSATKIIVLTLARTSSLIKSVPMGSFPSAYVCGITLDYLSRTFSLWT